MLNEIKLTVVNFALTNQMHICACAWIYRGTKNCGKSGLGRGPSNQTGNDGRTLEKTSRDLDKILSAIPQQWANQIRFELGRPPPTLQPCFAIRTARASQTPTDILSCKTRHFYGQLHDRKKPVIPAVDRWKASLQPEPTFSSSQWKTLYSPLVSNKQGDTNWKIAHRVLPTASPLPD